LQKESIFERFFQADSSTTRRYGGTGLGLAISQKIAMLLGGEVTFTSELNVGSVFKFTAPVESVDNRRSSRPVLSQGEECVVSIFLNQPAVAQSLLRVMRSLGIFCWPGPFGRVLAGDLFKRFKRVIVVTNDTSLIPDDFKVCSAQIDLLMLCRQACDSQPEWSSVHHLPKATILENYFVEHGWLKWHESLAWGPEAVLDRTNHGPLRVLLAEDNLVNCEVATGMLESFGFDVTVAYNGKEAVDLYLEHNFDLIFMDCLMPHMDGFEALKLIRSGPKPDGFIIALTANAMAGDRERCLVAGFDEYLSKPMSLQDMHTLISKIAERKQLNQLQVPETQGF
jgi:CheY-like chemotaxis protein